MVQKEIKLNTSHSLPNVRAKETRGGQKKKKKNLDFNSWLKKSKGEKYLETTNQPKSEWL